MTEFIYNQAYKSGGHWHIAKGLHITTVPRTVESKTREVIDFNKGVLASEASPDGRWYRPTTYGDPNVCQRCRQPESDSRHRGIALDRWSSNHAYEGPRVYPIIGDVAATIVTPEHQTASAKAACGQVGTIKVSNLKQRDVYRIMTAKKNVGKNITIEHVVTRLMVERDFVPEPLCGHCFNLLED